MGDPWQEVAEEYKKQPTQTTPTDQPGFVARTSETMGLTQHPLEQLKSEASQFAAHPVDTSIRTVGQAATNLRDLANKVSPVSVDQSGSFHLNNPLTGLRDAVGGQQFAQDIENNNYKGAAGDLTGAALPVILGGAKSAFSPADTSAMASRALRVPEKPPAPPEVAARNLAQAINPAVPEWPNFIRSVSKEGGNISDYASRNSLPLETQLDFVKAARGAGGEARDFFNNNLLNPFADQSASVQGSGYQGAAIGEGRTQATLANISNRIDTINDLLRSAYNKREGGQTMTALANEPDLVAEKNALTQILHDELAKRTGLTPEDVAGVRQRAGRSFSIADQTEGAVNQRQSSAGKAAEGRRDFPITGGHLLRAGIDYFRGGPEGISNRRFVRSLGDINSIPTSSFPVVQSPLSLDIAPPKRSPAWLNLKVGSE